MKICLINNLYKPFNRGGAEKITETIANGLVRAGHEIFIITTKPYKGKFQIPNPKSQIYYLNSLYYNLNKLPKFLRFFWHLWNMFDLVSYFKIKKILRREKGDAVITNNLIGLGFLTPWAVRRLKLKQIHLAHDIQLIHPSGFLCFGQENKISGLWARNYAGLCSRLFASPQAVIFPSRWLMNMYLDKIFFIKSKRIILPNPIILRPVVKLKTADKNFKFLYLGQIEKHKGLNLLIRAFKKIEEIFPQAELIIAGSGSELESAKLQAGQDQRIKFLGWQDEPKVNQLLRTCHSLVVPTLCYENCPVVILEAFNSGLPVMASNLGGISELLSKNAGLVFKPADSDDLADKMAWAINHKNDLAQIAMAAKEKVVWCNLENYIKEIEGLIRR